MKEFKDKVKDQDLFGYKINFNFDRRGETHTTVVGGCVSIFIKIIFAIYIFLCFKRMILHEDDDLKVAYGSQDLEELGDVSLNETKMLPFWVVRNQKHPKDGGV